LIHKCVEKKTLEKEANSKH